MCSGRDDADDTGYHPFRRGYLHHLVAGSTCVFRTTGADDTELSQNAVQHLADEVKSASTAAADVAIDVEQNVFMRQAVWQSSAPRLHYRGFKNASLLLFLMRAMWPRPRRSGWCHKSIVKAAVSRVSAGSKQAGELGTM